MADGAPGGRRQIVLSADPTGRVRRAIRFLSQCVEPGAGATPRTAFHSRTP